MDMSALVLDFVESLEVEGGRAAKTAENYQRYLERFVEFAGNIDVKDINQEMIRKYRLWLNRHKNDQGEELALITQSYHLIALRGFLKYLSDRDIPSLSADKIKLPRIDGRAVVEIKREAGTETDERIQI